MHIIRIFFIMDTLNVTELRAEIYNIIDVIAETHKPIKILGKRNKAVLISEEDWNAINETLYLLSIPGMRESIQEGMNQSLNTCAKNLDW
jgi:antitoxin YefM